MIYLNQDKENPINLRLSESTISGNTSYFLFEIGNEFDPYNNLQYLLLNNYSPSTVRYDLVYFNLSSSGSTSGGTNVPIYLSEGQHYYKAYEMSASTNNPSDAIKLLEEGILNVEITQPNF